MIKTCCVVKVVDLNWKETKFKESSVLVDNTKRFISFDVEYNSGNEGNFKVKECEETKNSRYLHLENKNGCVTLVDTKEIEDYCFEKVAYEFLKRHPFIKNVKQNY